MKGAEDEVVLAGHSFRKRFSFIAALEETWHPATDVYETGREIIIKMELPGIDIKDISVMLENSRVVVEGVRVDPSLEEKVSFQRMEISYGPFKRVVVLPPGTKIRNAAARYRNGFLEIILPLAEEAAMGTRRIAIE